MRLVGVEVEVVQAVVGTRRWMVRRRRQEGCCRLVTAIALPFGSELTRRGFGCGVSDYSPRRWTVANWAVCVLVVLFCDPLTAGWAKITNFTLTFVQAKRRSFCL
jgi:hypothetical protein